MSNFWDRIALRFLIRPLGVGETREMIDYRLEQAGFKGPQMFSDAAVTAIHEYTGGYPRKLSMFCHYLLENLVMQDRTVVDEELVRQVVDSENRLVSTPVGGPPDVF